MTAASNGSTVLVVEDDPDILEALVEVLEEHGYHARSAAHGREALEALRRDGPRPCVILLDLMMPEMNGTQFRAAQRADPTIATIPVVLVTADPGAEGIAHDLGAAGWLRKPLRLDALLTTIARACAHDASR